ncbi:hypothetical protein [Polyangium sorediatum]|uniref:HTH cro/C1-type domain-containing protein n=1 Tax=Polyangium sorediatum TaxID=889274 RepID=A0ABT6P8V6_9BACT|nr:hypothetical protein [Polyangium sorediatum]MDI1437059.1 hypothetical protein [Polyangium sorediatum]
MTEHDQGHDETPDSLPAVLSAEQADRVRKALAPHVTTRTLWKASEPIGYAPKYVQAFLRGEIHCTLHFAAGVAHALDVDVEALVRGGEP